MIRTPSFPLLGAQVQSLVEELRPHKPRGIPSPQKESICSFTYSFIPHFGTSVWTIRCMRCREPCDKQGWQITKKQMKNSLSTQDAQKSSMRDSTHTWCVNYKGIEVILSEEQCAWVQNRRLILFLGLRKPTFGEKVSSEKKEPLADEKWPMG